MPLRYLFCLILSGRLRQVSLLPNDNLLKNIFDFTTAGDWDRVAAAERLPALHYSVDFFFIFLSFGILVFIWEL